MRTIPTTFTEQLHSLPLNTMNNDGFAAMQELRAKGFTVALGLRQADVESLNGLANQTAIREYCPNDLSRRFGDEAMVQKWLEKGRLTFQLRKIGEASLSGIVWTGPEKCVDLPDCDSTFAIRLSEEVAGQGLAAPLTIAALSGSVALGVKKIGLETWQSNIGAVKTYEKAGAKHIATRKGRRPTLAPEGEIDDVRLFMQFPHTFIN
jgi:RimJ/RimL family protein N-acetyltransferase